MANKYLMDEYIIPNRWYLDNKGEELLYLGRASQKVIGGWHYNICHIYLKKSKLKRFLGESFNNLSCQELLSTCVAQGIRCYFFSENHRKFIKECGVKNEPVLKGSIKADHVIFDFE